MRSPGSDVRGIRRRLHITMILIAVGVAITLGLGFLLCVNASMPGNRGHILFVPLLLVTTGVTIAFLAAPECRSAQYSAAQCWDAVFTRQ